MVNLIFFCCSSKNDIRPGLTFSTSEKRKLDEYKKQQDDSNKKVKSAREQESDLREKGLETAISPQNMGFKMMQKMGYKPGTSLGFSSPGILEPIKVSIKTSNAGVGKEAVPQKVMERRKAYNSKIDTMQKAFQTCILEKNARKKLMNDISIGQRICEELDFRAVCQLYHNLIMYTQNIIY